LAFAAAITLAKAKSEHHGQTYHFCSNECKQKFDKSPDSYAQKGGHQGQQSHGGSPSHGTQPQGGEKQPQSSGQQAPQHHKPT